VPNVHYSHVLAVGSMYDLICFFRLSNRIAMHVAGVDKEDKLLPRGCGVVGVV
jgi:hypothetical protein